MVGNLTSIGYFGFEVTLLLVSGLIILLIDVKEFGHRAMKKEEKAARITGWLNVILGITVFLSMWVVRAFV